MIVELSGMQIIFVFTLSIKQYNSALSLLCGAFTKSTNRFSENCFGLVFEEIVFCVFTRHNTSHNLRIDLDATTITVQPYVKYLGIVLDKDLP